MRGRAPFVVCTGGEPLLQLDEAGRRGAAARRVRGGRRDQRHSGRPRRPGLDLRQPEGGRAAEADPAATSSSSSTRRRERPRRSFEDLDFPRLLLQPMDGPEREKNTRLAVEYCLAHPQWRLSLQTHKYLGIA